ncbi:MAG: hypothetical protein ACK5N9_15710, partial [Pirellula sp.]
IGQTTLAPPHSYVCEEFHTQVVGSSCAFERPRSTEYHPDFGFTIRIEPRENRNDYHHSEEIGRSNCHEWKWLVRGR